MSLIPVNLIYETTCIASTAVPFIPPPNSLIQYNETIFIVEGYIMNLNTQTIDLHVKLLEDVSPVELQNPIAFPISLN